VAQGDPCGQHQAGVIRQSRRTFHSSRSANAEPMTAQGHNAKNSH
jgi:hypothetical protein